MKKYSVFHIEGGLGKHIAATAVAKCIKANHPDRELIVVGAYPEIFVNLEYVDKVFRLGVTPYFYQEYIDGQDTLVFRQEPYFTSEYIAKKTHLIENWCKMHGLVYNGEKPELSFNYRQKQFALNKWASPKPVMLIQTNGGPFKGQPYAYSWTRDLPPTLAQKIVDHYSEQYTIFQICRQGSYTLNNVGVISDENLSYMDLLSVLLISEKRVFIDSAFQHAAAALNLPSTVLWIGTSPVLLGYDLHKNIVANKPAKFKLPDSYLFEYNWEGVMYECPYTDDNIFNTNEVLDTITQQ